MTNGVRGVGERVQRVLRRLDGFQQRHRWAAFPFAVFKKFGDDQAGNLAALIAYYGFFSLFPLLLVFVTVLGFVTHGNAHLEDRLLHSALAQFPVIGTQIQHNVHSLKGSGVGLGIGLAGTLYGGLGVANAAQNALDRVWEVPLVSRPGFFPRLARSILLLAVVVVGIVATTVLTGLASGTGTLGAGLRVGAVAASASINAAVFIVGFRVLTARDIPWKQLLPGAIVAGVVWQILQALGGYYVGHQLKGASQTYGFFAVVIGLLSWLYLEAQVLLISAEINVVRAHRLWPRSLVPPPLTEADRRAYAAYAEVEERRPEEDVGVAFADPDRLHPAEQEDSDDSRVEGRGTVAMQRREQTHTGEERG